MNEVKYQPTHINKIKIHISFFNQYLRNRRCKNKIKFIAKNRIFKRLATTNKYFNNINNNNTKRIRIINKLFILKLINYETFKIIIICV